MVTHWESSTRPLFVKTIWRDGQHHVVLRQEEEPITRRNTHFSSNNSARSIRSAKTNSSNSKKVSIKLLLAGVGTFNSAGPKLKKNINSVNTVGDMSSPRETGSLKNSKGIMNTYLETKQNKNINLSIKSNSIDIHVGRKIYDKVGAVSPYFGYGNYIEPYNSLSERVMVWLDLAVQSGNYTKDTKIQPQRSVTACHISQKWQHKALTRNNSLNCKVSNNSDTNENIFRVEGTSQVLQSMKSLDSSYYPCEENAIEVDNVPLNHQLSSEVEENLVVKDLKQILPKNHTKSVKRQLHIFMPNLPNKYSDCDSSVLSSKISSISLQRSIRCAKSRNNVK